MIVLDQIRPERVEETWPHMVAYLSRACRRGVSAVGPDEIRLRALFRQCDLWAIYERDRPLPLLAAAVTTIRGTVVTISHLGGVRLAEWFDAARTEFERLARKNGMTEIEVEGRFGWARFLRGYDPCRIAMRKVL